MSFLPSLQIFLCAMRTAKLFSLEEEKGRERNYLSVNYKKNLTEISRCRGIAVKPTLGCKDGGQSTEDVGTTSPDQKHLIPPRKLQRGEGQALLSDRGFLLPN